MRPIICCPNHGTLKWFLQHAEVSVVHAAPIVYESAFPSLLRKTLAKAGYDVDFAVSTIDSLRKARGRRTVYEELVVFRGSQEVGSYSPPKASWEEAVIDLMNLSKPGYVSTQTKRRVKGVLGIIAQIDFTEHDGQESAARPTTFADPYELLEVQRDASMEDVSRAYHRMIRLYHPDRVAGTGAKLRGLAEAETKAINAAFESIKKQRASTSAK